MPLRTSTLLRSLGAEEDPSVIGAEDGALRLWFGKHSVQAGQFMSRWLQPTYLITGVINTGRTIEHVQSEMPIEVESEDEGLAWLATILGKAIPQDLKPQWLLDGERLGHLMPGRNHKPAEQGSLAAAP